MCYNSSKTYTNRSVEMQHDDFVQEERDLLRVLCRDAALYAAKRGNRDLYRYGKKLLSKFQGDSLYVNLKYNDIIVLRDMVRSGITILEKSFNQKDVIDKDLIEMVTENEEQEEQKNQSIDENVHLFDLNRKQTELLLGLRDKVNGKLKEEDREVHET